MRTFYIILLLCISGTSFAQVEGISASKLATPTIYPVETRKMELEPSFATGYSKKYWDTNKKLHNTFTSADSTGVGAEFGFRLTYGVFKNAEIGVVMPVDMSGISIGFKYLFWDTDQRGIALTMGWNQPLGNRFFDKKKLSYDDMPKIVTGVIFTNNFSDQLSTDMTFQFQKGLKEIIPEQKVDIYAGCDLGYYFVDEFQLVLGANYIQSKFSDENANNQVLTLNPGITVEPAEQFLMVLNVPIDILGKNINKTVGFAFALTITLK